MRTPMILLIPMVFGLGLVACKGQKSPQNTPPATTKTATPKPQEAAEATPQPQAVADTKPATTWMEKIQQECGEEDVAVYGTDKGVVAMDAKGRKRVHLNSLPTSFLSVDPISRTLWISEEYSAPTEDSPDGKKVTLWLQDLESMGEPIAVIKGLPPHPSIIRIGSSISLLPPAQEVEIILQIDSEKAPKLEVNRGTNYYAISEEEMDEAVKLVIGHEDALKVVAKRAASKAEAPMDCKDKRQKLVIKGMDSKYCGDGTAEKGEDEDDEEYQERLENNLVCGLGVPVPLTDWYRSVVFFLSDGEFLHHVQFALYEDKTKSFLNPITLKPVPAAQFDVANHLSSSLIELFADDFPDIRPDIRDEEKPKDLWPSFDHVHVSKSGKYYLLDNNIVSKEGSSITIGEGSTKRGGGWLYGGCFLE